MLCEICHKKKATVHYTEIVNNQMVKINLCEGCAKEKGIDIYAKFTIADLLTGLTNMEGVKSQMEDRECETCKMTYRQFKEIGRFGCANCYVSFEEMLKPLFESIHKATRHVGKIPQRWLKRCASEVELKKMEDNLNQAIANEDFEDAVRIRDQIRELREAKKSQA